MLNILKVAWPLIVANAFWNLQLTIDRIFLGQYSTEALGAAMAVMGIFWVPMNLLHQTAAYVSTFVAQALGSSQFNKVGPSVWQALYISTAGGLLFLCLHPLAPTLFAWVGHTENIQNLEVVYFQALCFSALPTALVAVASGFYTGLEETKMVMAINFVGLFANVILDYMLIFGHWGAPALGIVGAGYATAFANFLAALFGLFLLMRKKFESQYKTRSGWRLDKDLSFRFIKFGIPSGLQWALEGLAFTLFLIILGRMPNGDAVLAGSSIAVTIMLLALLPSLGVAQAVAVRVGHSLGQNDPDTAEKESWDGLKLCLIYIFTIALSFAFIPEFYIYWFKNASNLELWQQTQEFAKIILLYVAAFSTFDSCNLVLASCLRGAGDTRFVSLVALLLPWPLMVIPTFLVIEWSHAVYWGWGFASIFIITQALVFLFRFRGGRWKTMRVL